MGVAVAVMVGVMVAVGVGKRAGVHAGYVHARRIIRIMVVVLFMVCYVSI